MRTVKFRGKRTEDGEWVYGDLGQSKGIVFISDQNLKPQDTWAFTYEIDPETVGQFTGLLDKNGKEVFENDVVIIKNAVLLSQEYNFPEDDPKENWGDLKGVVRYSECQYIVTCDDIDFPLNTYPKSEIELIGSVHDNKDLLK